MKNHELKETVWGGDRMPPSVQAAHPKAQCVVYSGDDATGAGGVPSIPLNACLFDHRVPGTQSVGRTNSHVHVHYSPRMRSITSLDSFVLCLEPLTTTLSDRNSRRLHHTFYTFYPVGELRKDTLHSETRATRTRITLQ